MNPLHTSQESRQQNILEKSNNQKNILEDSFQKSSQRKSSATINNNDNNDDNNTTHRHPLQNNCTVDSSSSNSTTNIELIFEKPCLLTQNDIDEFKSNPLAQFIVNALRVNLITANNNNNNNNRGKITANGISIEIPQPSSRMNDDDDDNDNTNTKNKSYCWTVARHDPVVYHWSSPLLHYLRSMIQEQRRNTTTPPTIIKISNKKLFEICNQDDWNTYLPFGRISEYFLSFCQQENVTCHFDHSKNLCIVIRH